MIVLGIETSCDETAVGIVSANATSDGGGKIIANLVASQLAEHRPYGGVVPEIAARAHLDRLDNMIRDAMIEANITWDDISGIAATTGPGLIGGVMVGAMTGKSIAAVTNKPFIAVNHLEAHALTVRLAGGVAFPYLLLLTSGGHCQLLLVKGVEDYRTLGSTRDDAAGECFDKSARLLGLGYPGGPLLEKAAQRGNPSRYPLPLPLVGNGECDFSFSGLKTAVRLLVERHAASDNHSPAEAKQFTADVAASLQTTIATVLADRTANALHKLAADNIRPAALAVAGGVAANATIRAALTTLAAQHNVQFIAPPMSLCTDNGVMVAWAGVERLRLGLSDGLDTASRPRWPLTEMVAG